jgi:hypothetical protein
MTWTRIAQELPFEYPQSIQALEQAKQRGWNVVVSQTGDFPQYLFQKEAEKHILASQLLTNESWNWTWDQKEFAQEGTDEMGTADPHIAHMISQELQ